MKIKDNGYIGATGYLSLEDCILSWGEEGRKIFDGLIRNQLTNKDIHTPLDGNSFQSMESPTPFIPFMKGSKKIYE
jgi:hypothetical protein